MLFHPSPVRTPSDRQKVGRICPRLDLWVLTGTLSSLNTNVVGTSSPTRKHVVTLPGRRTSGTQMQIKYANLNDLGVYARAAVFHMKNSTFKGNPILLAMKLRFPFTKTYSSRFRLAHKTRCVELCPHLQCNPDFIRIYLAINVHTSILLASKYISKVSLRFEGEPLKQHAWKLFKIIVTVRK